MRSRWPDRYGLVEAVGSLRTLMPLVMVGIGLVSFFGQLLAAHDCVTAVLVGLGAGVNGIGLLAAVG